MLSLIWNSMGFAALTWQQLVMFAVAILLVYLGVYRKYEPLLLIPIGFGMLLVNFPLSGIMDEGGLLNILYKGISLGIYPPLIFIGVGALTDFSPLIANPRSMLMGAAAQIGIFLTFVGANWLGFNLVESASISIIGGADGPTAIFVASLLAPELLAPIAIAAYGYMALVPVIQPTIIYALTSKKERQITMSQLRPVSQLERIIFPFVVTLFGGLVVPSSLPLLGSLMFGNLIREAKVVERLAKTAQNELINIVTILLGLTVGASAQAESFLSWQTVLILSLGVVAFALSTTMGLLFGKLAMVLSKGKINPMIGVAGVSAVPMAARVVHSIGQKENKDNYLIMHAMGPNVAGVIGSAVAAGIFLALLGG